MTIKESIEQKLNAAFQVRASRQSLMQQITTLLTNVADMDSSLNVFIKDYSTKLYIDKSNPICCVELKRDGRIVCDPWPADRQNLRRLPDFEEWIVDTVVEYLDSRGVYKLDPHSKQVAKCECHERDSAFRCDSCKEDGCWGHMEDTRSSEAWIELFEAKVIDPDGWRKDGLSLREPIHVDDFAMRWAMSTCKQPPHPWLEAVLRRLEE